MSAEIEDVTVAGAAFRHEAFFYATPNDFVEYASAFVRDGLRAGDEVAVVVTEEKTGWLRDALGKDADLVTFGEMESVGRNPARIIPAWQEILTGSLAAGRTLRGIGEPIWPGRSSDELVECQRHESLLNVAFSDGPGWYLMCPYDMAGLDPMVLEVAERSHPHVIGPDGRSAAYEGVPSASEPFSRELPEPTVPIETRPFTASELSDLRSLVADRARAHGMGRDQVEDFVLAVNEVVTNSLRYGGGRGSMRLWADGPTLICEVADEGRIADALIGRRKPASMQEGGAGLWLVNQVCDLVQVRSSAAGSVVRLHMGRR